MGVPTRPSRWRFLGPFFPEILLARGNLGNYFKKDTDEYDHQIDPRWPLRMLRFINFGRLAWLAGVAWILSLAKGTMAAEPLAEDPRGKPRTTEVKVLVLNFDPIVLPVAKTRLHEECRWQKPRDLAQGYAADVEKASGGRIRYKVVEWQDIDEFPVKADGFKYTLEEYLRCHRAGKGWHDPDGADYPKVIAQYKIAERVEKGEIDEVWWFGGPYFGFFESAMAGRGAFNINGGVFGPDKVRCPRGFAIMGFNYERGVAEMLHNLCHRTEATMGRVFGGWRAEKLDNDWARFAANFKQSEGVAAVGSCHYPRTRRQATITATSATWKARPMTGSTTRT